MTFVPESFRQSLVDDLRKLTLRMSPDEMAGHPSISGMLIASGVLESVIHATDRGLGEPFRTALTSGNTEIHRNCGGALKFVAGYRDPHWDCERCQKRNPSIHETQLVEMASRNSSRAGDRPLGHGDEE